MADKALTPVRFLRPWRMYNPGETAGFDASQVSYLIKGGIAYMPGAKPAAEPDEPSEPTTEPAARRPAKKKPASRK